MAEDSLIPDDLLRQIIAVGQVDLLVGLPTIAHSEAVAEIVDAVRACFRTHFPRQRTALLNVDRGAQDGTQEALLQRWVAASPAAAAPSGLRTTHCMTSAAVAWADADAAIRCIVAAGDLLQARAVVVLDPDVDRLTPSWVAALAAPARDPHIDLVAPAYRRHAADGLLVTQLVRPLMRAMSAWHVREPLLAEFGCSGRFAGHCTQAGWSAPPAQRATNLWILGEALSGGFTVRQADLGPRRLRPDRRRTPLSDVFRQVVGSLFSTIEAHAGQWAPPAEGVEAQFVGPPADSSDPGPPPGHSAAQLVESSVRDLEAIDDVLTLILRPETHLAVTAASRGTPGGLPAQLWAEAVAEFLIAHRHGVMHRDHIARALLPLYMARTGTFLLEHGEDAADALELADEEICRAFVAARPVIMERWLLPA